MGTVYVQRAFMYAPLLLRFIWTVLVMCMIGLAIFLIYPIYVKWRTSPTFTSIDSTNYPVWHIEFPAVTVCSNMKIRQAEFDKQILKEP